MSDYSEWTEHIGLSNVGESQVREAMEIAAISSVQNRCNVYYQNDVRNGFDEFCAKHSITYIAYSPAGGGSRHELLRYEPILEELAAKHEATVYQIVLAWLLQKGDNVLPIPGASKISSAVSSVHAVNVNLSAEDSNIGLTHLVAPECHLSTAPKTMPILNATGGIANFAVRQFLV